MAGSLHPPFSLFLPEGKEKTGRARSKREKQGDAATGARKRYGLFDTHVSARGVVRAGILEVDARPVLPSSLSLTWRFMKKEGLPNKIGRPSFFNTHQGSGSGKRRKSIRQQPNPPLAPRRGLETFVSNSRHRAAPPFSLFHRARRIRLRPKSRRFAAVGLRHASADAVSFRKRGAPAAPRAVGRGGRNGAERRPRRQAGAERAEFLPTTWGVHWTSPQRAVDYPARRAGTIPPPEWACTSPPPGGTPQWP